MKHLDQMSNQWIHVANELELPSFVISSIQVSQLDNDKASLRRVVEWWFQYTDNPEWKTIQQLQGEYAENISLACIHRLYGKAG